MTDQQQLLLARAEHHGDWHAYIDCPARGPLGYCLGHGGDELDDDGQPISEPWSPETASEALAREGWEVVGAWRDAAPDAEHQYEADVRPAPPIRS